MIHLQHAATQRLHAESSGLGSKSEQATLREEWCIINKVKVLECIVTEFKFLSHFLSLPEFIKKYCYVDKLLLNI